MNEIKVIIADDHQLFRNGLEELLRKYNDIQIVKSVADGFDFMEIAKTQLDADIYCSI
jgi:two-component system, NarL family, response regulator NreC